MQLFPETETTFMLPSPAGNLEVLATQAQPSSNRRITVIISHPHPLHGGTMLNKVVTTLAKTFHELGLRTVRFNFRGVGRSTGEYDLGNGEAMDLQTVAAWVEAVQPEDELWLAGFSFGAFIAIRAAGQLPVQQLIAVAPPVSRFITTKQSDTEALETIDPWNLQAYPPQCPWLVIQGEDDDVVSPQEVFDWAEKLAPQVKLIRMPKAGHFFHGQLMELRRVLGEEFGE